VTTGKPPRFSVVLSIAAAIAAASCGRTAPERAARPERIVAIAPSVVETLYALGLEQRVAAVGDYARWPPEAAAKTNIGGLMDPRLETIVALDADLAILVDSEAALARALGQLGVEVLTVPSESVADVEVAIMAIAERTGTDGAGRRLVADLRAELAPRPVVVGRRVLLVVGRQPGELSELYVAASGTFLDELLGRLGGANVMADVDARYPRIGLEEVLVRRPEIVVELAAEPLPIETVQRLEADWRREMGDGAPCVVTVAGDYVLIPGPRLGRFYGEMAAALRRCENEA
jgi:iron complex transport system substrate-binding protein